MAINKKLIHFNKFTTFNSKKLSANSDNTQYTLGVNGTVTTGSPEINYHSIVYIKDRKQIWTHGQLYDGNESPVIVLDDISDAGSTGDQNYIYYDRNACKLFGWDVYIEDYVELAPSTACLGETFADENPFITEKLLEGNLDYGSSYGPSLQNVNLYNMVTNILKVVKSASGGNYTQGFVKVNYSTYTFYAWVSGNGVYTQTNLNGPITECTTKIYFITINNHIAELGIYDTSGYVYIPPVNSHYNLIKGHDVATATKAGLMSADDKAKLDGLATDVLFTYEISYSNPIRNGFTNTDWSADTSSEVYEDTQYTELIGLVNKIKEFGDAGYKSCRIKLHFKDDTHNEYYYVDMPVYTAVDIQNGYVMSMPDLYFINAGGYKMKLVGNDSMFCNETANQREKWWEGYGIATESKPGLMSAAMVQKLNNLVDSMEVMTQAQYDALTTKDPNKIYFIKG